jgi:membrane protease YdiL (CAAX protease family)
MPMIRDLISTRSHERAMSEHENTPNTPSPDEQPRDQTGQPSEPAKLDHWSPVVDSMRTHADPLVTKAGNPIDPQDPGTGLSRLIAILFTVFVVGFIVLWQNTPEQTRQTMFYGQPTPAEQAEEPLPQPDMPAPGNFGQVDLMGRMFLRGLDMFKAQNMMSEIDAPSMSFINEDRVRLVMLYAEFENTDIALEQLEALRLELLGFNTDPDPEAIEISTNDLVLQEIDILRTIYTVGSDALSEDQAQQLKDRYGYIGHVALTHGLANTDPVRAKLTNNVMPLMIFLIMVGLAVIVGPLLGLVMLILGIVQYASGKLKMRMRVPKPGGSIYLETYAVFVFGFCIIAVGTFLVMNSGYPELGALSMVLQWLLVGTIFWGLFRGAKMQDWRLATGWHKGEGVLKEIGCGVLAYLASIPIYILGVIITVLLLLMKDFFAATANGGAPVDPQPVSNPVFELIANADLFWVIFFFVLATTWAPLVEEAIFRGALFRHLRARLHWTVCGIITAILFAFMHDYGPLMVAPLIALGFMFAFMREWRGSLIAPITAHFIHNFSLISIMIFLVQIIKDPV